MKITIVGNNTTSQQGQESVTTKKETVTGEDTIRALKVEHQRLLRVEAQNKPRKLTAEELAALDARIKAEDAKRTEEERDARFAAWMNRKERFFDRYGNEI